MKTPAVLLAALFLTPSLYAELPDAKADPLALALTSSNWSWENTDSGKRSVEDIQFYRGGFAENPKFFTARWEVTSPQTVTLRNTNRRTPQDGKVAYLVFDAAFTHFVGFDFNGKTTVEGFRREALDPNRTAPTDKRSTKLTDEALKSSPVGQWRWFLGPDITINDDGTAQLQNGHGHWNWTDKERREFRIVWETSKFVDTLTLLSDGQRVSGTNNRGVTVTGERIKESPAP